MSDNDSEEEPSIEEILASIRQIISDDDEEGLGDAPAEEEAAAEEPATEPEPEPEPEAEATPEPEPEPEPAPEPEPEPEPAADEGVLELTEEMQEAPDDKPMEIDLQDAASEPAEDTGDEEIITGQTAASTLGSMAKLSTSMPVSRSGKYRGYDGVTVEDIVRDALHPLLREWVDENLPDMVESLVQAELQKLSNRLKDD